MAKAKLLIAIVLGLLGCAACEDPVGTCEDPFQEGEIGDACTLGVKRSDCEGADRRNVFTRETEEQGRQRCEAAGYKLMPNDPDAKNPRPWLLRRIGNRPEAPANSSGN